MWYNFQWKWRPPPPPRVSIPMHTPLSILTLQSDGRSGYIIRQWHRRPEVGGGGGGEAAPPPPQSKSVGGGGQNAFLFLPQKAPPPKKKKNNNRKGEEGERKNTIYKLRLVYSNVWKLIYAWFFVFAARARTDYHSAWIPLAYSQMGEGGGARNCLDKYVIYQQT